MCALPRSPRDLVALETQYSASAGRLNWRACVPSSCSGDVPARGSLHADHARETNTISSCGLVTWSGYVDLFNLLP